MDEWNEIMKKSDWGDHHVFQTMFCHAKSPRVFFDSRQRKYCSWNGQLWDVSKDKNYHLTLANQSLHFLYNARAQYVGQQLNAFECKQT